MVQEKFLHASLCREWALIPLIKIKYYNYTYIILNPKIIDKKIEYAKDGSKEMDQ